MVLLITKYNLSPRWVQLLLVLILYVLCIKLHTFDLKNNIVECMTTDNPGKDDTNNINSRQGSELPRRFYPNSPLYLTDAEIETMRPYAVNEGTAVARRSTYPTPPLSTFSPAYNPASVDNITTIPSTAYTPTSPAYAPDTMPSETLSRINTSNLPPLSAEVHGAEALNIPQSDICTFILGKNDNIPDYAYNIWHRHVIVNDAGTRIISDTIQDYSNKFRSFRK